MTSVVSTPSSSGTTDVKHNEALPEDKFAANVDALFELITEIITDLYDRGHNVVDPKIVSIAGIALKAFSRTGLIETFISLSHKHWSLIQKRDRKYFVEHAGQIFAGIKLDKIEAFSNLFRENEDGTILIGKEDEDLIGDYFFTLVRISISYIHRRRGPYIQDKKPAYKVKYEENIDLEKEAKLWNVKLEF